MSDALPAATCPRCGGGFACGAASGPAAHCDCFGIRLSDAQRAAIAGQWPGRCLCMNCLRDLGATPVLTSPSSGVRA
ncbi:MAG: cysteine-rich CWC family protein [Roseateles sp.]|uniref:cysteine-rich CWC family protein n=1 Tax=Roseateles sp. TaxID=1971397 RepID=UPI004035B194